MEPQVCLPDPRDRDGSFEPELVKKGEIRIDGMDDRIVGLYAAGLTVRDIEAHLLDIYGLKVSPDLISRVTDAVLDEVREWQSRALDRMYPIVIFDALRGKIRDADSRMVKNRAAYVALGVTRPARGSGPVDCRELGGSENDPGDRFPRQRRQVLAVADERAEEPGHAGYPDRGRRRAEGLPRGDSAGTIVDRPLQNGLHGHIHPTVH